MELSNPILKDLIKIQSENNNTLKFRTYVSPNGGQKQKHYHSKIIEIFTVVKGTLTVYIDDNIREMKEGESVTINPLQVHKFQNNTEQEVSFDVTIKPSGQFKNALQIIYGLARDGKVYLNAIPKNPISLAISVHMMDAFSTKAPLRIQKAGIKLLVKIGKTIGLERKLMNRYCGKE